MVRVNANQPQHRKNPTGSPKPHVVGGHGAHTQLPARFKASLVLQPWVAITGVSLEQRRRRTDRRHQKELLSSSGATTVRCRQTPQKKSGTQGNDPLDYYLVTPLWVPNEKKTFLTAWSYPPSRCTYQSQRVACLPAAVTRLPHMVP